MIDPAGQSGRPSSTWPSRSPVAVMSWKVGIRASCSSATQRLSNAISTPERSYHGKTSLGLATENVSRNPCSHAAFGVIRAHPLSAVRSLPGLCKLEVTGSITVRSIGKVLQRSIFRTQNGIRP
jgi:hypothetical protein